MVSRVSNTRLIIMIMLILAVVVLVGIALSCSCSSPSDSTPQSQNATDFTLPTLTGVNVTLSELEGTSVVLNFWSISCYWCRKQLPYLESVAIQSGGEVKVIAVNIFDSVVSVQSFFGEYEPTMTVGLNENGEVFVSYCQNFGNAGGSVPFTLFVDSEGMVQYVKIGAFASEAQLWNALNDIFGITIP